MSRARQVGWVTIGVLFVAEVIFGFLENRVVVVGLLACLLTATVVMKLNERKRHHADRGRTGDRDDPDPSPRISTGVAFGPVTFGTYGSPITFTRFPAAIGTGEGARLKMSESDTPILAFKLARLHWEMGGAWSLRPMHANTQTCIERDMDAVCANAGWGDPTHCTDAPGADHTCGFYGMKNPDDLASEAASFAVLLDVEFSGKVIVAESGYRAGHQRVLRVYVPDCLICGETATALALIPTDHRHGNDWGPEWFEYPWPTCRWHVRHYEMRGGATVPLAVVAKHMHGDLPFADGWTR